MTGPHRIARIETRILDIPTIRPHKLSFGAISRQSPVIVQLWLDDGGYGFGEAATIGGPSWNEESPESIKHAIDADLAPVLIGQDFRDSSPAIAQTCIGALKAAGLTPLDCGALPTPALALYGLSR